MRMTDEDLKCKSKLGPVMFSVDRLEETFRRELGWFRRELVSHTVSPHLALSPISSLSFLVPLINLNSFLRGMPPLPQIPCPLIAEVSSMAATPSGSLPETCSRFLSLSSGTSHCYWCSPLIKVLGLMIEWCVEDLILLYMYYFLTFLLTNESLKTQ